MHQHAELYSMLAGVVTGGGGLRFLVYVSKNLPPLPANSGWWTQFFYAMVKGGSGLDPNSVIVPADAMRDAGK